MHLTLFHYIAITVALGCLAAAVTIIALMARNWLEHRRDERRFRHVLTHVTRDFR